MGAKIFGAATVTTAIGIFAVKKALTNDGDIDDGGLGSWNQPDPDQSTIQADITNMTQTPQTVPAASPPTLSPAEMQVMQQMACQAASNAAAAGAAGAAGAATAAAAAAGAVGAAGAAAA